MNKNKIIYWVTTSLIAAVMLFSGYQYIASQQMKEAFTHLGFPSYFRIELAIFKLLGVVVLLFPQFPKRLKEWAYAGFGIVFISASIAHYYSGDELSIAIVPIIFLGVLAVSYLFMNKVITKE